MDNKRSHQARLAATPLPNMRAATLLSNMRATASLSNINLKKEEATPLSNMNLNGGSTKNMCTCTHICTHKYSYTSTHAHTPAHTPMHTHAHAHKHAHVCTPCRNAHMHMPHVHSHSEFGGKWRESPTLTLTTFESKI